MTPLHKAVDRGDIRICQLLIEYHTIFLIVKFRGEIETAY